jgi:hypothetical protein
MLILAFLLINSHSISYFKQSALTDVEQNHTSIKLNETSAKDVVWLMDTKNGQCLGHHGDFSECGELTLWIWSKLRRGVSLKSVAAMGEMSDDIHSVNECLGRRRSLTKESELKMLPCSSSPMSPTGWTFDEVTGKLSDNNPISKVIGHTCISNHNIILQNCVNGFTSLKRVIFQRSSNPVIVPLNLESTTVVAAKQIPESDEFRDVGDWKCPVTGQSFPRNLDVCLAAPVQTACSVSVASMRGGSRAADTSNSAGRQVFMGSGVFSKVFISCLLHKMTFCLPHQVILVIYCRP